MERRSLMGPPYIDYCGADLIRDIIAVPRNRKLVLLVRLLIFMDPWSLVLMSVLTMVFDTAELLVCMRYYMIA